MITFAKSTNEIVIVNSKETKSFIERFNKNIVGQDFLNSCRKAAELFNKRNRSKY